MENLARVEVEGVQNNSPLFHRGVGNSVKTNLPDSWPSSNYSDRTERALSSEHHNANNIKNSVGEYSIPSTFRLPWGSHRNVKTSEKSALAFQYIPSLLDLDI